jgi:oligoribonuclease NrnB/cAMP/cGMP phosphodiesterase (DHH superfamily)
MQNKVTVVYHSADFDGLFCREIARHFLKSEILTLIGWAYKDPKLEFPNEGKVYVLDLSPECFSEFPGMDVAQSRVVWIDHHATAIEKWGTYLPGLRIDGVAACRLTWQWFASEGPGITCKADYLSRAVEEPLAVRLAGEYDVWDHRGDGDLEFQLGLRAQEEIPWSGLLGEQSEFLSARIIQTGRFVQQYVKATAAEKMASAFVLSWKGIKFLALNGAHKGSLTFESRDVPETGHDALMIFYWTGKAWEFSLYHAKHRTDLDLSKIALEYGGGGHKGACGFRTKQIPFPLYPQ